MNTRIAVILVLLYTSLVGESNAALPAVAFSDGTFDDSHWSFTSISNDNGDGYVLSSQILSGGNPDEYREVEHWVVTGATQARSSVAGVHIFDAAVYDPSIQGGIGSITFSIDYLNVDVHGFGERFGPAIVQDGEVFIGELFSTTADGTQIGVWQSLSSQIVKRNDFFKIDPTIDDLRDQSAHPDFSATASPVTLGFFTFNTNPPGLPVGFTDLLIVGWDNWELAVNLVPESGTFVLFSSAMLVYCGFSRTRGNQLERGDRVRLDEFS